MYVWMRLGIDLWLYRNQPMGLFDTHVTSHRIRPWDMDLFGELNNGRALSIFDIGRIVLARRTGLVDLLRRKGWGLTLAGGTTRYRRRVRAFDKVETRARLLGWDDRFMYLEHAMFRQGDCTSHLLVRAAVTDRQGLVSTDRVIAAIGVTGTSPALPGWVQAWAAADAERPWPPMQDS